MINFCSCRRRFRKTSHPAQTDVLVRCGQAHTREGAVLEKSINIPSMLLQESDGFSQTSRLKHCRQFSVIPTRNGAGMHPDDSRGNGIISTTHKAFSSAFCSNCHGRTLLGFIASHPQHPTRVVQILKTPCQKLRIVSILQVLTISGFHRKQFFGFHRKQIKKISFFF